MAGSETEDSDEQEKPRWIAGVFGLNWADWMSKLGFGCDARTVQYCHPFAISNLVIARHEAISSY
ncbi:MAG: hypothetical protein ACOX7C_04745 [Brevefilum sp.]